MRLPDGREGTVVYHGLDGYGIVWGRQEVNVEAILGCCPVIGIHRVDVDIPAVEAMLRDRYPSAQVECVGGEYEIVITVADA